MRVFEKRGRTVAAVAVAVGLTGWLALPALASSGTGLPAAVTGSSAVATGAVTGAVTGTQRLAADVLPGLNLLAPVGSAPVGQTLHIGVALSLPDLAAAQAYEQSEFDPASANYHHFLTPAQFASMFGVAPQTYDGVVSWLRSGGLTIDQTTGVGDWVAASGTVAQLDRLFSTQIDAYSVKGVSFVANTTAPLVPAGESILSVVGLNTLQRFSTPGDPSGGAPAAGSAPSPPGCLPSCDYDPSALWSMYDMPSSNEGQGQRIAIFGDGASATTVSDLRDFEKHNNLPQVPVTVRNTGPGSFTDTSGQEEWDIDTQASTGMAPDVYNLDLYFASSLYDASVETLFTQWASDNLDKQANASFGECETNPTNPVTGPLSQMPYGSELGDDLEPVAEQTLLQATTQGQTLFASAGDTGSSCPVIVLPVVGAGNGVANQVVPFDNYPCASDYAVCVGGTVLWSDGNTPPKRAIERAWEFTGGGAAPFQAEPAFQKGVSAIDIPCAVNDGWPPPPSPFPPGTICRGAPDVAAMSGDVSDNGYNIYDAGVYSPGLGGGTSLSSPLWVGMWSRIQAGAPSATDSTGTTIYPGWGFADPIIYKTAENATDYANDFFDVTIGDNGVYHAAPGWDYVSGWGVPDVAKLMTTIDGSTTPTTTELPPAPTTPPPSSCTALWTKGAHTATDTFGNQDPQLTLLEGDMAPGPNNTLAVKLTVANLSETVPTGATGADWYMTWTYKGTVYFAQAQLGPVPGIAPTFDDGTVQKVGTSSQYQAAHTDTGKFTLGKDGVVEIDVPLANVGSPVAGDTLLQPAGATYIEVGVPPNPAGAGAASLQGVDTGGPLNDYVVGTITGSGCTLPE